MDVNRARDLLENLLERARSSEEKIFLTKREINALAVFFGDEIASNDEISLVETVKDSKKHDLPALAISSILIEDDKLEPNAMLCVDFGTSFSKAFATRIGNNDEPELIDLAIGETDSQLTSPSELFIDGDLIYFGSSARHRWEELQAPSDRLIDSIKQFITLNREVAALGQRQMPNTQDPQQNFSQRDILLLYLAHLTALTERAVEAKGLSRDIKRRFTHPAWKDGAKDQNEKEMRQLMGEAIVLARSAPAAFATNMPVASARKLLDELASMGPSIIPAVLIDASVREATAAGAGGLLATGEGKREAYLVLDIGAGTTDVAGFYCVNNANNDRMRVFEVSSAANAKNMAGNTLDGALQRFVFDKSGLPTESAEAHLAGKALRRQIRFYKEELFRTGYISVELNTDQIVNIALDEFLKYAPVVHFSEIITAMVAQAAASLAGDLNRVHLVATGGGASLPIVRELGEKGVNFDGKHIGLNIMEAMSPNVRETYPDLIDPYPQIAVALGGSLPNLPEQRASIAVGITRTPSTRLGPVYKS